MDLLDWMLARSIVQTLIFTALAAACAASLRQGRWARAGLAGASLSGVVSLVYLVAEVQARTADASGLAAWLWEHDLVEPLNWVSTLGLAVTVAAVLLDRGRPRAAQPAPGVVAYGEQQPFSPTHRPGEG